ncbi:MAG: phosphatase PAP2 family protein [Hamadaea sp.]|nr:phosphatase PAP2 family protein [Hamadaea sp.]
MTEESRPSRLRAWALSLAPARGTGGRPAALFEVPLVVLGVLLFARLHAAGGKDLTVATANAVALQSAERTLHIDIELAVNRWLTEHPFLIMPSVFYYRLYYLVIAGALIWLYLRHGDGYRTARRTLFTMSFLAVPVFWALPMSPPRFATPGVVDIIAENDIFGTFANQDGQNVYSAMPSMHTAWSLWCGYAVWSALRAAHPRWALLAWAFPLGMIAVVFLTGNHYVLDVVGSVVLLGAAIAVVSLWRRLTARRRSPAGDVAVSSA